MKGLGKRREERKWSEHTGKEGRRERKGREGRRQCKPECVLG